MLGSLLILFVMIELMICELDCLIFVVEDRLLWKFFMMKVLRFMIFLFGEVVLVGGVGVVCLDKGR